MNFNYDKVKNRVETENHWSTYSDMFMVLSLVFLFLYVITGARMGTVNSQMQESKEKKEEVQKKLNDQIALLEGRLQETQERLKEYQNITLQYVDKDATVREKEEYAKLFDKMQELTMAAVDKSKLIRSEIDQLNLRLKETLQKKDDIDEYQKTLKHIISKNAVLKSTVLDKDHNLKISQFSLEESRKKLSANVGKINKLSIDLSNEKQKRDAILLKLEATKKGFDERVTIINKEYERKISEIQLQNKKNEKELQERIEEINQSFAKVKANLNRSKRSLHKTEKQLQFEKEITKKLKTEYNQEIAKAKSQYERKNREISTLKQTYQLEKKNLISQKMKAQEKAKENLKRKIASIDQSYAEKIEKIKAEMNKMEQVYLDKLSNTAPITGERLKIAKALKDAFEENGITAQVNVESGDVVIDFGLSYFDTDKWFIKKGMKQRLIQLIPIYAKTLFETSDKIKTVEIIGFSSPTYRGRFIDPKSINEKYKNAINYNLDLSYKRARSIFNFIFDRKKISFDYQEKLLPYVKVTGRSYFTEEVRINETKDKDGRFPTTAECDKYGCLESQKVIIKYYLKE